MKSRAMGSGSETTAPGGPAASENRFGLLRVPGATLAASTRGQAALECWAM